MSPLAVADRGSRRARCWYLGLAPSEEANHEEICSHAERLDLRAVGIVLDKVQSCGLQRWRFS
jgi:hypothetical protein